MIDFEETESRTKLLTVKCSPARLAKMILYMPLTFLATIAPAAVSVTTPVSDPAIRIIRAIQRIARKAIGARPCTNAMPVAAGWLASPDVLAIGTRCCDAGLARTRQVSVCGSCNE